ncbi:hypothetical protein F5Y00DRAFT_269499 [Daldinia vernicosa]|uniref:uncharacterized protein n=1 Tax=Daldinia vernicosa TaxID=114800 RepID=UPI0020078182|nr:uncharacterized protein F5Y00DRAFT_269499 [Daldinia vernicosa]KAI0849513.1 hypothetical protein F5Y00DRAFT_269499 [Daldinia vernicosa]
MNRTIHSRDMQGYDSLEERHGNNQDPRIPPRPGNKVTKKGLRRFNNDEISTGRGSNDGFIVEETTHPPGNGQSQRNQPKHSSRDTSTQGTGISLTGFRGMVDRLNWGGPSPAEQACDERFDKLEEKYHQTKEKNKKQQIEMEHLHDQVQALEESNQIIKRRNDKLQGYVDNKEAAIGYQEPDEAITSKFRSLHHQIRTWANKFCVNSDKPIKLAFPDEEQFRLLQRVLPMMGNVDDWATCLSDSKRRRKFVRGWVALNVTETMFRTLPSKNYQWDSGTDYWIPEQTRRGLVDVERALLNSGHAITLSSFHQWRAVTMALLAKKYPDFTEEDVMIENAASVLKVINPLGHERDTTQRLIENVYKPALELSRLLRRQRASWSVRFPATRQQPVPGGNTAAIPTALRAIFDDGVMKDMDLDEEEIPSSDQYCHKYVEIIVGPALFKSGNIDGEQYDMENVIEKAEVSCAAAPNLTSG